MSIYRCIWCIWECMGIYGYSWVCMGIYGYVWVCMGIYRYIGIVKWSSMCLNDYPLGLGSLKA